MYNRAERIEDFGDFTKLTLLGALTVTSIGRQLSYMMGIPLGCDEAAPNHRNVTAKGRGKGHTNTMTAN